MAHSKSNYRNVMLAAILAATVGQAHAAPPVGNAEAFDLSIHIDILGLTQFDIEAPTRADIVDATESISDLQSVASIIDADPLNLITLSTGTATAEAQYVAGPQSAIAARASVEDLELGVLGLAQLDILQLLGGTGALRRQAHVHHRQASEHGRRQQERHQHHDEVQESRDLQRRWVFLEASNAHDASPLAEVD